MKHGGDLSEAIQCHGGTPESWLDLSTGINPWPWPVPQPLPDDVWHRLPSRTEMEALTGAARRAYGAPDDVGIAAASGTQSLIQLAPYLATPGPVAIVGPTYSEHNRPGSKPATPSSQLIIWMRFPTVRFMRWLSIPTIPMAGSPIPPHFPDSGDAERPGRVAGRGRGLCRCGPGHHCDRSVFRSARAYSPLVRKILWTRRTAAWFCRRRHGHNSTGHRGVGTMALFGPGAVHRHGRARRPGVGGSTCAGSWRIRPAGSTMCW